MLEYALFLTKRVILQFFVMPFKGIYIRWKDKPYLANILQIKTITLDKINSHLPKVILALINTHSNEYFWEKNRQVTTQNKCDFSQHKKTHFGYFDFDKNSINPHSPLNPWAFIHVCNEAITLRACLDSILPAIQRGIIIYNDCTDGSEEIILDFCQKYPSFIPIKYPYTVQICNPSREENKFVSSCNFALSYIPKKQWFINIDADHIYDAKKLYKALYLAKSRYDIVCIARIYYVLVKNKEVFIGNVQGRTTIENFFANGIDHHLIYNDNLNYKVYKRENCSKHFYASLSWKNIRRYIFTELNNYHFPFLKTSRRISKQHKNNDEAIKNAFSLDEIRQSPLVGTRIDPALLDKDKILAIYDSFDWSKANYKKP